MKTTMTKREVKKALDLQTDAALGRFLDVTKSAANQWDEDKPLPEERQWQLCALRPDLFVTPPARKDGQPYTT